MKRIFVATAGFTVVAVTGAVLAQQAASQPRISTTRQIQVIGVAANSQSHGAWFVDLQTNSIIFCERTQNETRCHTTSIP